MKKPKKPSTYLDRDMLETVCKDIFYKTHWEDTDYVYERESYGQTNVHATTVGELRKALAEYEDTDLIIDEGDYECNIYVVVRPPKDPEKLRAKLKEEYVEKLEAWKQKRKEMLKKELEELG